MIVLLYMMDVGIFTHMSLYILYYYQKTLLSCHYPQVRMDIENRGGIHTAFCKTMRVHVAEP